MTGEYKTSSASTESADTYALDKSCAIAPVKLSQSSDQERSGTVCCGISKTFSHKSDSSSRIIPILEEDEDPCLLHREKRLRMSNPEHSDLLVIQVETGFTLVDSRNSTLFEQKNDSTSDINRILEEDEDSYLLQREKKLKVSNPEQSDLPVIHFETGLTLDDCRKNTFLGSETFGETAEFGPCVDIDEKGLLHEAEPPQNNDAEEMIAKLNGSAGGDHYTEISKPYRNKIDKRELSVADSLSVDTFPYHGLYFTSMDTDFSMKQLVGSIESTFQPRNEIANVAVNEDSSSCSRKKLLVLDVNGLLVTLLSYIPYDYDFDELINRKAVFNRPHVHDFLNFCFEKFNVGIWSSRTRRNVDPIIDYLLGNDKQKLAFTWDQSHCTNSGYSSVEKRGKPLLLKKLKKLWDKCEPDLPWEKGDYNETNTVLVDDTPHKALSNPPYNAIFPHSYRFTDTTDNSLGPGGDLRVYLEGLAAAENVQEYVKQHPFGQRPITEKNLSWAYYRKVLEAVSTPPRNEELTSNEHNGENQE